MLELLGNAQRAVSAQGTSTLAEIATGEFKPCWEERGHALLRRLGVGHVARHHGVALELLVHQHVCV